MEGDVLTENFITLNNPPEDIAFTVYGMLIYWLHHNEDGGKWRGLRRGRERERISS